ncbi:MAG: ABC transporter substrate-binding protein, partial [Chloroflexota bacterium]
LSVALNHEREPFDNPDFRRALSLALNRYEASETLSKIANVKYVGGVMRPGSEYAATDEEMSAWSGYGTDIEAARAEAQELLSAAGIDEGFSFTFKNRDVPMPYEPMGIWLVDQWRQIGLNVELQVVEGADFISQRAAGDFDAAMDWECGFMDEPDLQLAKYLSLDKSGANYSRYTNETLDDLYEQQSRATSFDERRELIREFERVLLDENAHTFPTLWWFKINPHSSKVQGWKQLPSHYLNQSLRDVWLMPE